MCLTVVKLKCICSYGLPPKLCATMDGSPPLGLKDRWGSQLERVGLGHSKEGFPEIRHCWIDKLSLEMIFS